MISDGVEVEIFAAIMWGRKERCGWVCVGFCIFWMVVVVVAGVSLFGCEGGDKGGKSSSSKMLKDSRNVELSVVVVVVMLVVVVLVADAGASAVEGAV